MGDFFPGKTLEKLSQEAGLDRPDKFPKLPWRLYQLPSLKAFWIVAILPLDMGLKLQFYQCGSFGVWQYELIVEEILASQEEKACLARSLDKYFKMFQELGMVKILKGA